MNSLEQVVKLHHLETKWLVAPSFRVGHQWVESLVRCGLPIVNLRPTTMFRLAIDLVSDQLASQGKTVAGDWIGTLAIDAAWNRLPADGYFGQLPRSLALSKMIADSLLALRLANVEVDRIDAAKFQPATKIRDLQACHANYQQLLATHDLVDEADVLRLACRRLRESQHAFGPHSFVLVPDGMHLRGMYREFLEAIPAQRRVLIERPVPRTAVDSDPAPNAAFHFFRAVGDVNQVREVFRRCLARATPLDDVEILCTHDESFVPLIYAASHLRAGEGDRAGGVGGSGDPPSSDPPATVHRLPVTYADGLPASLSRPGRALSGWLKWIDAGYPQQRLAELIAEGLFEIRDPTRPAFSYCARLLRPLSIGQGALHYLPKIGEQITALEGQQQDAANDPDAAALHRRVNGYKALKRLVRQLLKLATAIEGGEDGELLKAAAEFLNTAARSVDELDRYSAEALLRQIDERRLWLQQLDLTLNSASWLVALPSQTRVMGSGPRPGHLHVAQLGSGGHSGRGNTFLLGMDERRFPGSCMQDAILLDGERSRLSRELESSGQRIEARLEELTAVLKTLTGQVTLSWTCNELVDDREVFPSPSLLSIFRKVANEPGADMDRLCAAAGAPVSFAPDREEKALNETERWLWRLSDERVRGSNQIGLVEARYPRLAAGRVARLLQDFGPYNGHVPAAGKALDPFQADPPIFSASALETLGRCPLAFFFRNGLELFTADQLESDSDQWLDARQIGLLLHAVFRQFMSELSEAGERPNFERDHQRLAEILAATAQQWRADIPPANENAYRSQYWQLVRICRIFLQDEQEHCQSSRPRFFEVALGMQGDGTAVDDDRAVRVDLPSGRRLLARGQIDRVDQVAEDRYAIWDYKLGSGYGYERSDPFRQGRRVQSMLYLSMIQSVLREKLSPAAAVERFGYFFPGLRTQGLRIDWETDQLRSGLSILDRLGDAVAHGAFLATDKKDDCTYCDYQAICRHLDALCGHSKQLLDGNELPVLNPLRGLRRG